ncbi:aspartate kinase [Methylosinus sp. RM1]|uniref:amino acid kinase family protein n=1 Tax=Methylosinus sp. RM1 TaxID=2583817 RepID=UPI00140E4E44|nr:aspartate kinase [Methylosinus sp. RM1]
MPPSPSAETRPLVVKLGGSLAASPALRQWLAALRRYPGPLALVPGGGPFADAVRSAQKVLRFSDAAAHDMAIMAMEQYGRALCDLEPGLRPAATPQEAAAAHARGAIAVWSPVAMTRADPQIPASWDMTSDSLAAWYAHEAGARALLLIKSVDFPPPPRGGRSSAAGARVGVTPADVGMTPPRTAPRSDPPPEGEGGGAASIVDPCFAHYARGLDVYIAGPAALREAPETFARGGLPGARFDFTREQSIAS